GGARVDSRVPPRGRDGRLRGPADRTAVRRSAATDVPGPRLGPAGGRLFHGRADGRGRRGHRTRRISFAGAAPQSRQGRHRGSPRLAHRAAILRPGGATQHAVGGGRADGPHVHGRKSAKNLWWPLGCAPGRRRGSDPYGRGSGGVMTYNTLMVLTG